MDTIPLIKYPSYLPIPSNFKFQEYSTYIRNKNTITKIRRYRLIGKIKDNGKLKINKSFNSNNTIRLRYINKKDGLWIIIREKWPSNNLNLNVSLLYKNRYLYLKIPKDYIGVWYKNGYYTEFVIIPKFLDLNDLFWETFGILIGEMSKTYISIANTEPKILNNLITFFNISKFINKESWKFRLCINSREIKSIKPVISQSKTYWADKLKVNPKAIKSVGLYKQFKSNLYPNYGEIEIKFFNKPLKKVIDHLIKFVKDNATKNINYSIAFLRGLIAAEGNCDGRSKKINKIRAIRIASKFEEERLFYATVCKKLGLNVKVYKNQHNIEIHGIDSFIKSFKFDLFSLNERRNNNFKERLSNLDTIKALKLLIDKELSIKQIVNILGLKDYRNMNKNFSILFKKGILVRKKIKKVGYLYKIKDKLAFDVAQRMHNN